MSGVSGARQWPALIIAALLLSFGAAAPRLARAQAAADEAEVVDQPAAAPAPSMTARMVEQLSAVYADLAALIGDNPAEAVGWAQEDIENLGDWEYRIVRIDEREDAAVEAALNALGNERWEVYWVADGNGGTRFYLKRPSLSYLSRVPLSTLFRLIPGGAQ